MDHQSKQTDNTFKGYYEDILAKLMELGLSSIQIDQLRKYGVPATDSVTGFYEGRSGEGRISTLWRAIDHIKRTGQVAFYIEMDLRNLGGLNAVLGHSGANEIFAKIASVISKEFKLACSTAILFRHGGDELSAFLIDTSEAAAMRAIRTIRNRVRKLANDYRLNNIPHPKFPGNVRRQGFGVHFGTCQLSADHENNPALVFMEADIKLERGKKRTGSK